MISIRDTRLNLKKNIAENNLTISSVIAIYMTAVGGLFAQMSAGVINIKRGSLEDISRLAMPVAIWVILACISIGCLIFFIRFIAKIKESTAQNWMNIATVLVFAIGLNIAIPLEMWSIVTFGLATITLKTYFLWSEAKRAQIGDSAAAYLRTILRNYIVLTAGAFIVFATFDVYVKSQIELSQIVSTSSHPSYDALAGVLKATPASMVHLERLHADFQSSRVLANLVALAAGVATICAFIYAFFTAVTIRKITVEEVLNDYDRFYSRSRPNRTQGGQPTPDDDSLRRREQSTANTTIRGILISARPVTSTLAPTIACGAYVHTTSTPVNIGVLSLLFLTVALTTAFGFMYNDVVDADKDRNRIDPRPIQLGLVAPGSLLIAACATSILSLLLSVFISYAAFLIVAGTIFLLYLYSYTNRVAGLASNSITAACTALLFVLGMTVGEFTSSISILSVAAFLFTFAREIVLDLKDREADHLVGKPSFAQGRTTQSTLRAVFSISSIALITLIAGTALSRSWPLFLLGGVAAGALVVASLTTLHIKREQGIQRYVSLTRAAFLLIGIGLAFG